MENKKVLEQESLAEVSESTHPDGLGILPKIKTECDNILATKIKNKPRIEDISTLDGIFEKIHGNAQIPYSLDKELCNGYIRLIADQVVVNHRHINLLDQEIQNSPLNSSYRKAAYFEYEALCSEQLLLLERGVFGLLNHRFIGKYLSVVSELVVTPKGQDFLSDFFGDYAFSYISWNKSAYFEYGLKEQLRDHLAFIVAHFPDLSEADYTLIEKISSDAGINTEYQDFLEDIDFTIQSFYTTINALSPFVRNRFIRIQQDAVLAKWELVLRGIAYSISKDRKKYISPEMDVITLLSCLSFACIYAKDEGIKEIIPHIKACDFSPEALRYIGILLQETGYHKEAIKILIDYGDLTDVDVLECIFRVGISYPEWTGDILSLFHKRLASFGIEPIGLSWFVAELKKDVRDWKRTDISSQRVSHLLGLAYWAEGQSCIFLSGGKDWNYINRAWEAYTSCYTELKSVLLGMFPDYPKLPDVLSEAEVKMLSDYGHYLSNHSLEQEETLRIFEYLDEVLDDGRYLDVIFNTSLILWDFSKARSSLRKMDEKCVIDTGPFWIIYYMSSDDLDMKIQAVRLYIDTDRETCSLLDKETISQIKNFARNLYEEYRLNSKRSEEENDRFMFLYRAQAIELNHDIATAVRYWQEIAHLLKNGDVEVLQKLYLSITHPTDYASIRLTDSEEKDNLQKLLIGLQMDARVFYGAFLSDLQISELLYEITSIFRDFPDGLWLWFLLEWRGKHESSIVNHTKEQYGSVHVMDAPIFLQ